MSSARPKFLHFLHDFILLKLAYYLRIDPSDITVRPMDNLRANFDLVYKGKKYVIKMSNPIFLAKSEHVRFWDFDVRSGYYTNGRNKRIARDQNLCDFYLLIGMENNVPQEMFLLPVDKVPLSHVRISVDGESKYKQYAI